MNDFSIVLGVDAKHLKQLGWAWPTWERHKINTLRDGGVWRPLVIFYDKDEVKPKQIKERISHPYPQLVPWPPPGVTYNGDDKSKWFHPQRSKMLSGFVHVPAFFVHTSYWLKLDLDVIAVGNDDWIDPQWFSDNPSIVAHRWGFTKPADQMLKLDNWVRENSTRLSILSKFPDLNLQPNDGWERINHPRIISWCGFFSTALTRLASILAMNTVGEGKLPVPSQDGYLWYLAARTQHGIVRANMKERGWEWWATEGNIIKAVNRSIGAVPWYPD